MWGNIVAAFTPPPDDDAVADGAATASASAAHPSSASAADAVVAAAAQPAEDVEVLGRLAAFGSSVAAGLKRAADEARERAAQLSEENLLYREEAARRGAAESAADDMPRAAAAALAGDAKTMAETTFTDGRWRGCESGQLPWAPSDEAKAILAAPLMHSVLELSLDEHTFTSAPPLPQRTSVDLARFGERAADLARFDFGFDAHVATIMKLLELDANLARMHAKLAPRMPETDFWRNYFYRCARLREDAGMDPRALTTVPLPPPPPKAAARPAGGGKPRSKQGTPSPPPPPASPRASSVSTDSSYSLIDAPGTSSMGTGSVIEEDDESAANAALDADIQAVLDADDLDLDALGLDDVDVDEEGDLDDDDIEAQIARELADF